MPAPAQTRIICFLLFLLFAVFSPAHLPAAARAASPQALQLVNETSQEVLSLGIRSGRQAYSVRLDMPPGGKDRMENPGGTADLRVDVGTAFWHFRNVPLKGARGLRFAADKAEDKAGNKSVSLFLTTATGEALRTADEVQNLLPGPEATPVCALERFRPGMGIREVCALLESSLLRDDNDAVIASLGFAGMVWAARLFPGQTEDAEKGGGAWGPKHLDHMELRRDLNTETLTGLFGALYAQGYAPWQAELPGLDMNFAEMPGQDKARQKDILQRALEHFLAVGEGEAAVMLVPEAVLPELSDSPETDVQLFTVTLKPASRGLVVDITAYQGNGSR